MTYFCDRIRRVNQSIISFRHRPPATRHRGGKLSLANVTFLAAATTVKTTLSSYLNLLKRVNCLKFKRIWWLTSQRDNTVSLATCVVQVDSFFTTTRLHRRSIIHLFDLTRYRLIQPSVNCSTLFSWGNPQFNVTRPANSPVFIDNVQKLSVILPKYRVSNFHLLRRYAKVFAFVTLTWQAALVLSG